MSISNLKGDIGEAAFVLEAAKKGYWTGKMPQGCPYDFVLDKKDGVLHRVQVKYRSIDKAGNVRIKRENKTFTNRTTYTRDNIDYIAVYVTDYDKTYLIPISEVEDVTEIYLRCVAPKNNQKDKVRMIESYEQW